MDNHFDTIIWGPSLTGIQKAIDLRRSGQKVLLAGKFGFPGGKATESLASLFQAGDFEEDGFRADFLRRVEGLSQGIPYRNKHWTLMHPEAIKRVCWEMLSEEEIPLLFHVVPLERLPGDDPHNLRLFGREGEIALWARDIVDASDDRLLSRIEGNAGSVNIQINAFFTPGLPFDMPRFQVTRRLETSIGTYLSCSVPNVASGGLEKAFNRELDRLSKETWKDHQVRILMVPVFPEVKMEEGSPSAGGSALR